MTGARLTEQALLIVQVSAWLGCGAVIGAFYFLTLHWNVRMLAFSRPPLLGMALQLGRFALLAGVLTVIASHFGTLPLLLATAGITAARVAAVRFGEQT